MAAMNKATPKKPVNGPTAACSYPLLNVYFFWSSLLVLPVYLALRVAAARIYASALLAAAQDGAISEESLADFEWEALHRLDLLQVQPRRVRHPIAQIVVWTSSKLGRLVAGGLLVLVWFTFVAQIFIAEFLNSHPAMGWLNQPLVQLPWFHYLPSSVKNQWWEVFGTLLLLGLVLALIPLFRFVVKLSRVAKAGAPRKCSPSQ